MQARPRNDGAPVGCSRYRGVSVWKAGHLENNRTSLDPTYLVATGHAGPVLAAGRDSRGSSACGGLRPSRLGAPCGVRRSEPFSVAFSEFLGYASPRMRPGGSMCRDSRRIPVVDSSCVRWCRGAGADGWNGRKLGGASWLSTALHYSPVMASSGAGNSSVNSFGGSDGRSEFGASDWGAGWSGHCDHAMTVPSGMTGRG